MNATFQNQDSFMSNHLKGIGRLFYIIDPKESSYENWQDVPDFYVQSYPYFVLFMILEHIILRLEGRKGIRLNDGLTSISNGIFYECGRLLFRGLEAYIYTWIYTNWRLIELPWDNPITWYAALLGVDFCYYWLHRACHEVHILWAQHQVHHTSEDFNMGIGIRQSVAQGWFGFLFYMPLALFVPPAHFVAHQQFSLMYMFWIHTEAINSLGPLEYILNTPSHHRVHHGCNKYCLDVNYGGLLIIWDRLFGTFREERNKDEIIYGLLFNQPSFNIIHLQTFYTRYVIEKFQGFSSWGDKLKALFWGPSWEPGQVRLGDDDKKMEVEKREKYDVSLPLWWNLYLVLHYAVVLYGFHEFVLKNLGMSPLSTTIFVLYVLASLTIIGLLFDANKRAPILEIIRCSLLAFFARRVVAQTWLPITVPILQAFYVLSAMLWCLYSLKVFEMDQKRKNEKKE